MIGSKAMLHLNPEIVNRRMIRSLRDLKRAARRPLETADLPANVQGDREMREIFAMAGPLSKEMGIAFEIPAAWREANP